MPAGIDMGMGGQENEKNRNHEPKGPYVYELFSIMIHSGSASGGHYYAYIKDFQSNMWYCFNDQSVSRVRKLNIMIYELSANISCPGYESVQISSSFFILVSISIKVIWGFCL